MNKAFKNIVVINYTGRKGGGSLCAYEMAKALIENKKNVVAIISDTCSNLDMWKKLKLEELILLQTYSNGVSFIKNSLILFLKGNRRLSGVTKKYQIEYIYCPMICFWTGIINKKIDCRARVCIANNDPDPHLGDRNTGLLNLYGMQNVYKNADLIVVHSKKFIELVENKYKKKGCVLYLPLGRHNFYQNYENNLFFDGYEKEKVNFLFFGRIEEYKGISLLLDAYQTVLRSCNNVTLTIAGSGDCTVYKKVIKKLTVNLENRWIADEEVGRFFKGPNIVLVLPYQEATQSGPVLIALEYRVPVIATDVGGLSEQIEDGQTGLLVAPDSEAIGRAMADMAKNPASLEIYRRGIDKKLKELDWKALALKLDQRMIPLA